MKNKKIIISLISIGTVLLILALFSVRGLFMNFANKLMGSVTYPTSNGVQISCDDSTISVNATTTCTITGYLTGGSAGVAGKIQTQGGLSLVSVTPAQVWMDLKNLDPTTASQIDLINYVGSGTDNQFIIATMTIKGTSEGTGSVKLVASPFGNATNVVLTTNDSQSVPVSDASTNITVSNGGSTPDPTPTPSSDNTLKNLKVNGTDILISLNKTVASDVSSVSITAETNDTGATASGDIGTKSVSVGNNPFSILVTAENGSTRTYNFTVTREAPQAKSSINTLSALSITNATLNPPFSSSTTGYTALVENNVDKVTVSATREDNKSQITEGLGEHTLAVGINTIIVRVKAEDGSMNAYTITVTRKEEEHISDDTTKSSDNKLKSLEIQGATLIPKFDSSKEQNYVAIISDNETSITINAQANSNKADVSYSEASTDNKIEFAANLDTKNINIIVTAENGSKRYIPVTLMRQSYYNEHKTEVDTNTGNNTDTCTLILKSSVYTIDNDKLEVNNVNKNHSIDTIKSNLSSDCGNIMVSENKVVLSSDTQVKEYTINRVWIPQTGQKVIKYVAIIAVLLAGIAGLIFYKKKMEK